MNKAPSGNVPEIVMNHRIARLAVLLAALAPAVPALASMNIAQVFVKTSDVDRLDVAVRAYLDGWAKQDDAKAQPYFVRAAGGRRVLVLPPKDGWTTVLEATPQADPSLAEALSRALKARTIWLEVRGSALSWRYVVLDAGKIVSTGAEPKFEGPMPHYHDVEGLAWELLAQEGVPSAYRFLQQSDVKVAKDPKKGPQAMIYKVVPKGNALGVGAGSFGFTTPPRGKQAPVAIDAVLPILGPDGKSVDQSVDLITVVGKPDAASLDALAKTFAAIRARYEKALKGKVPFCHLVPDAYRLEVYTRLAKDPGACRSTYQKLLAKAREDAKKGPGIPKPPPAQPDHP